MTQPVLRELPLRLSVFKKQAEAFLNASGLKMEPLDYYVGYFDGDTLVCGGGYEGNVIKCVAVDEAYRGEGLTNALVTHLYMRLRESGASNVFLFTKPQNIPIFSDLSFYPIGQTDEAALMESRKGGVEAFCKAFAPYRGAGVNGCIVMNANPFTNGHLHLVKAAKAQCDALHVFVVETDRSLFPYAVRKRLVEEGVSGVSGVKVHGGGPYIISAATFPTYFLKQDTDAASVHARLDLNVFGRHIAPALSITRRFIGEEPLDPMTARYNEAMREVLPGFGVEPVIFSRLPHEGQAISASRVRALAKEGRMDEVKPLVPPSTYAYLQGEEARRLLQT